MSSASVWLPCWLSLPSYSNNGAHPPSPAINLALTLYKTSIFKLRDINLPVRSFMRSDHLNTKYPLWTFWLVSRLERQPGKVAMACLVGSRCLWRPNTSLENKHTFLSIQLCSDCQAASNIWILKRHLIPAGEALEHRSSCQRSARNRVCQRSQTCLFHPTLTQGCQNSTFETLKTYSGALTQPAQIFYGLNEPSYHTINYSITSIRK